jgi:transcriptional regulator with XRE-family HTH domain
MPELIGKPARAARIAAGLTLDQAAEAAIRSPRYIAQLERSNHFPLQVAERLARTYGVRLDTFLPQPQPGGAARLAGPAKRKSPARPRRR